MAKKKEVAVVAVNPFAAAATAAATAPAKKAKGTTFVLPRELNGEGKLVGQSLVLNESVTRAIEASAEEKAAHNKLDLHKGILAAWALDRTVEKIAELGTLPTTPISIVNHNGEAVTYVIQDKSGQNALSPEQVQMLHAVFGEEGATRMIETRTIYSFNSEVLAQQSQIEGKTVLDVVAAAVMGTPGLTDEQRAALLTAQSKTFVRPNTLIRVAELCGANVERITAWFQAVGSAVVKYVKP